MPVCRVPSQCPAESAVSRPRSACSARRRPLAARRALCLAMLLVASGGAQKLPVTPREPQPSRQEPIGPNFGGGTGDNGGYSAEDERRLRLLNADRHKAMVPQTNKLFRLANELDVEIARENPASVTPAQLRKVTEIEKLARGVKEKMSTSVRGVAPFSPTPPPLLR